MTGVDIVFHTAALKHVHLSEKSPNQVINTNILGIQNIISSARSNKVGKVIFTSSDKAVNPTNIMGASKLMGERLISSAHSNRISDEQVFVSTRFGNVLGSNGSVIPIFKDQINKGGPVTLTDPNMTRFVMTVEQSAKLVIDTAKIAQGGEVFVTKMPSIRIIDLAEIMIRFNSKKIKKDENIIIQEIGVKPGEKLFEELINSEEIRRTFELENYYCILPAINNSKNHYHNIISKEIKSPYISSPEISLTQAELENFLVGNKLI